MIELLLLLSLAAEPPIAPGLLEKGATLPSPPPKAILKYLGEYGSEAKKIYLSERGGKVTCLIDSTDLSDLEPTGRGRYRFPKASSNAGAEIRLEARGLRLGKEFYPRLPEPNRNFRVDMQKPLEELLKIAAASTAPAQPEALLPPDLVDLRGLPAAIHFDIRYATANNFMAAPLYSKAGAFAQRPVAEALMEAHRWLAQFGYGLLIHDAYRPWKVTKMFWEATPNNLRIFVADPQVGSRHNRGCAVDLTLFERKTGKPIEMVGGYDEMSDRSYPDYPGGTSLQRWHRDLLRREMEAEGFTVYSAEWWHFDYKDWRKYPIGNQSFEEIGAK